MQVPVRRLAFAGAMLCLVAWPAFAQAPSSGAPSSGAPSPGTAPRIDAQAAPSSVAEPTRAQTATGRRGMVVTQEKRATRIGVEILERGGNAVDAAVAVGFALAVTLPRAGNLGGGGFMMVHLADRNESVAIDYRETAPRGISADSFLDANRKADPEKSRNGPLAIGVPGTVAGLTLALERHGSGKFTLAELLAPAIALARDGIPVEDDLLDSLLLAQPRLARWPSAAKIFLKQDGTPLGAGDTLVQQDLARTLDAIARDGARAFYTGPIADEIVAAAVNSGGVLRRNDIEDYMPVVREPVRGTFRGYDVLSMPPASSGGVHLVEMLNILEGFPLRSLRANSPASLHLIIEAMKLAYADRAEYLGDSDFVDVPIELLTSKDYAAELREGIDSRQAREVGSTLPDPPAGGGGNTTHFSIVDADGNAVANTYSLNFNYGLGLVAGTTGILLNNTLDDFAAAPGAANAFGLTGGAGNAPAPGKRPLSSMTPTIVLKDGKVHLVTGAPGGSRIITTVLQVVLNAVEYGKSIGEAVTLPRVHHQWRPDEVTVEKAMPAEIVRALAARGHTIRFGPAAGSAHSILAIPDGYMGAADQRARGSLAAGY
jgi:gamma-glutamyltranspeptidase/glutathione hydrolase